MKNFIVKKSRNGHGLFTNINIKAGQTVFEIKGQKFHYTTLLKVGGTFLDNCFRYSEMMYLSPGDSDPAFLNHSCNPNCKIIKKDRKLFLVAIKDVKKGAELTFDYSTVTADDDIWKLKCNCGEKNCYGMIQKYTRLPKAIILDYLNRSLIPDYILKI